MPPKKTDPKKGAPVGNYKLGKQPKDILPPGLVGKERVAQPAKCDGEPNPDRQFEY